MDVGHGAGVVPGVKMHNNFKLPGLKPEEPARGNIWLLPALAGHGSGGILQKKSKDSGPFERMDICSLQNGNWWVNRMGIRSADRIT